MTGKKVLIVDDNFPIRDYAANSFTRVPISECVEAENIRDAHRLIVDGK